MREIKFRAFLKELNEIHLVDKIDFYYNFIDIDDTICDDTFEFDEIELMQYTGLKDTKGKEIYEGDIVCWVDSDGIKRKNEVFFENGGFRINNSLFEIADYGELEIIGNIYENPELLGDEE